MSLVKKNNVWFPSIFDEFLNPDWLGGVQNNEFNGPAVNIKESDTDFTLELLAPGRTKEDFNIEVNKAVLTISSEQKTESEKKDITGNYTRKEFEFKSFKRSFKLPQTIEEGEINGSYDSGVLTLKLPKRKEALPKPKRLIEIS
ncbi:Hsp20 family protein [Flavobacteriaceae bacterium R38]|nr:Hsp20 family protein [Flavobacteriaceae bacterium R38]